jgi:N-acetylmuramoyl-L-alanine amidase
MPSRLQRAPGVRPLLLALAAVAWLGQVRPAGASGLITRVEARRVGHGAALAIVGMRDLKVTSFTLEDPRRLIFNLEEAALALDLLAAAPLKLSGVSRARLGQFRSRPDVARIVLDLDERAPVPAWKVVRGAQPDETLIVFAPSGPLTLSTPTLEQSARGLTLRLAGAGALTRRTAALDNPPRVFTDFANAELEVNYRKRFASGPLREIRMAQQSPDGETPVARLVIELREPQQFSESADGDDLVITFGRPPARAPATVKPLAGRKIVLDPGHGGSDPGSIGKDENSGEAVFESDIALALGLRLANLLEAAGAEVTLTREQDTYIERPSLRARVANDLQADALVSIHCNSCSKPNTLSGTMTLYHRPDSLPLAEAVQEELLAAWGTLNKEVRLRDDLTLIKRTDCPSIIVETAFINHDDDRALLLDPEMQEKGARAIMQGVIRFFSESRGAQQQ